MASNLFFTNIEALNTKFNDYLPVNGKAASATVADSAATATSATTAASCTGNSATATTATKWDGASKTVSAAAASGGADGDIWFQYI